MSESPKNYKRTALICFVFSDLCLFGAIWKYVALERRIQYADPGLGGLDDLLYVILLFGAFLVLLIIAIVLLVLQKKR